MGEGRKELPRRKREKTGFGEYVPERSRCGRDPVKGWGHKGEIRLHTLTVMNAGLVRKAERLRLRGRRADRTEAYGGGGGE